MKAKIEIREIKTPMGTIGDFEATLKIEAEDYEKKPIDINDSINLQGQIARLTMLTQMLKDTTRKFYETFNEMDCDGNLHINFSDDEERDERTCGDDSR